uniref:Uncharacterized protein n=1 Tax=Knipowitschia caucasica TaxID=637954 RepID=A0AAV2KKT8_KNICA
MDKAELQQSHRLSRLLRAAVSPWSSNSTSGLLDGPFTRTYPLGEQLLEDISLLYNKELKTRHLAGCNYSTGDHVKKNKSGYFLFCSTASSSVGDLTTIKPAPANASSHHSL